MMAFPTPDNEFARLRDLRSLKILDTPPDLRFELAVSFLARELNVPIALVTLVDTKRQWFKAAYGVDTNEIDRNISVCAHAICEVSSCEPIDRVYEIVNLKNDLRFFRNPLVIEEPHCRAYLSFVLQSESGNNIGTLCLVDIQPRIFTDEEKRLLINVGKLVEGLIHRS